MKARFGAGIAALLGLLLLLSPALGEPLFVGGLKEYSNAPAEVEEEAGFWEEEKGLVQAVLLLRAPPDKALERLKEETWKAREEGFEEQGEARATLKKRLNQALRQPRKALERLLKRDSGQVLSEFDGGVVVEAPASFFERPAVKELFVRGESDRFVYRALLDVSVPTTSAAVFWDRNVNGLGARIAIVDTGIDVNHPAIAVSVDGNARVFDQNDFSNDGFVDDGAGHGTHVAGITASSDAVYRGTAPGASHLINAKGLNSRGSGATSWLTKAMSWAVSGVAEGAHVENNSWGCSFVSCTPNGEGFLSLYVDWLADTYDALMVFSAGNSGFHPSNPIIGTIGVPADAYNALTVGSMDDRGTVARSDDVRSTFSSVGPTADFRKKPDITAPGSNILSANAAHETGADFVSKSGTSMAAPHVSGAGALLAAAGLDAMASKAVLINSAQDIGAPGWDRETGWGYLDMNQAWKDRNLVRRLEIQEGGVRFFHLDANASPKATLAWYRHTANPEAAALESVPRLNDLDLYLFDANTGTLLDYSISGKDSVEQVQSETMDSSVLLWHAYTRDFSHGFDTEQAALAVDSNFHAANGVVLEADINYPRPARAGIPFPVQVFVTNQGDLPAFNVTAALNGEADINAEDVSQNTVPPALGPGQTRIFEFLVNAPSGGNLGLTATASSVSYLTQFNSAADVSTVELLPLAEVEIITDLNRIYAGNEVDLVMEASDVNHLERLTITIDAGTPDYVFTPGDLNWPDGNRFAVVWDSTSTNDADHNLFVNGQWDDNVNVMVRRFLKSDNNAPQVLDFALPPRGYQPLTPFYRATVLEPFLSTAQIFFHSITDDNQVTGTTFIDFPPCKKIGLERICRLLFDENTLIDGTLIRYGLYFRDQNGRETYFPDENGLFGKVDHTPPVTTMDVNTPWTSTPVVTLTATDNLPGRLYTRYAIGTPPSFYQGTQVPLTEGKNLIQFQSEDRGENLEAMQSHWVILDTNAPLIHIVSRRPEGRFLPDESIWFEVGIEDTTPLSIEFEITDLNGARAFFQSLATDFNAWQKPRGIEYRDNPGLRPGPYIGRLVFTDRLGRQAVATSRFIIADANTPYAMTSLDLNSGHFLLDANTGLSIDANVQGDTNATLSVIRHSQLPASGGSLVGVRDLNLFFEVHATPDLYEGLGRARLEATLAGVDLNSLGLDMNQLLLYKWSEDANAWLHPAFYALGYGVDLNRGVTWVDVNTFSTFALLADTEAPGITSLTANPGKGEVGDALTITLHAENNENGLEAFFLLEPGLAKYALTGQGNGLYVLDLNTTGFESGSYNVLARLQDTAGNFSTADVSFTLTAPATEGSGNGDSQPNNTPSGTGGGGGGGSGGGGYGGGGGGGGSGSAAPPPKQDENTQTLEEEEEEAEPPQPPAEDLPEPAEEPKEPVTEPAPRDAPLIPSAEPDPAVEENPPALPEPEAAQPPTAFFNITEAGPLAAGTLILAGAAALLLWRRFGRKPL